LISGSLGNKKSFEKFSLSEINSAPLLTTICLLKVKQIHYVGSY
jgi:hypothetical protein